MPTWYEVFDNEEVQYVTRRRVAVITALMAGTAIVTLTALLYLHAGTQPPGLAMALVPLAGVLVTAGCVGWLRRVRRVVWCIKLSDREVVGYDYARRQHRIDWTRAVSVELHDHGLVIRGPASTALDIPHLFPDFAALSHRIAQYADFYEIPVLVSGQPWQQIDVYAIYPFLGETTSSDHPSAANGTS